VAQLFVDLWLWFKAVASAWVTIIGFVFGVVLLVVEKVRNRPTNYRPSVVIFLVYLVAAMFWTWRDEHDARIVYNQPTGILTAAFVQANPAISGFGVSASLVIENPGDPSIFNWYTESIEANGKRVNGLIALTHQELTLKLAATTWTLAQTTQYFSEE
jgi:uncharacterized membrane protein YtjA (UPF0391 family)